MKLSRTFEYGPDENFGDGFKPLWAPSFDVVSGLGAAHDTLEHMSKGETLKDELTAFGAMLWGRYDSGYFSTQRDPLRHLAHELLEIVVKADFDIPKEARVGREMRSCIFHEPASELVDRMRFAIPSVAESTDRRDPDECESDPTGWETHISEELGRKRQHMISWLEYGMYCAYRRYDATMYPGDLSSLFTSIATAFDKLAESCSKIYGERLRVSVDTKTKEWEVALLFPYAEDDRGRLRYTQERAQRGIG